MEALWRPLEAHHGVAEMGGRVDALPGEAHLHREGARECMAVGAWPSPGVADAGGGARGLGERPVVSSVVRVALEAHHGVAHMRSGVDALAVRADGQPERPDEGMAIGALPSAGVADAGGCARELRERPGDRVALQAHYGVAGVCRYVDVLAVRAQHDPDRTGQGMAVGA